jgi:snurportin-1
LNFNDEEEMEVESVQKKYRVNKKYKHLLMLSEWMLEVPQDFAENWIMVPCPAGKRVTIVAFQVFQDFMSFEIMIY